MHLFAVMTMTHELEISCFVYNIYEHRVLYCIRRRLFTKSSLIFAKKKQRETLQSWRKLLSFILEASSFGSMTKNRDTSRIL